MTKITHVNVKLDEVKPVVGEEPDRSRISELMEELLTPISESLNPDQIEVACRMLCEKAALKREEIVKAEKQAKKEERERATRLKAQEAVEKEISALNEFLNKIDDQVRELEKAGQVEDKTIIDKLPSAADISDGKATPGKQMDKILQTKIDLPKTQHLESNIRKLKLSKTEYIKAREAKLIERDELIRYDRQLETENAKLQVVTQDAQSQQRACELLQEILNTWVKAEEGLAKLKQVMPFITSQGWEQQIMSKGWGNRAFINLFGSILRPGRVDDLTLSILIDHCHTNELFPSMDYTRLGTQKHLMAEFSTINPEGPEVDPDSRAVEAIQEAFEEPEGEGPYLGVA